MSDSTSKKSARLAALAGCSSRHAKRWLASPDNVSERLAKRLETAAAIDAENDEVDKALRTSALLLGRAGAEIKKRRVEKAQLEARLAELEGDG